VVKQLDTIIKQRGVLLAKGRLLGLQFDTLFTDGLYVRIARHAIELADKIVKALKEKGYRFLITPQTNQLFVVMENEQWKRISSQAGLEVWEYPDGHHTAVRIATSWATREEDVDALIEML
jgi:threonine aldolase